MPQIWCLIKTKDAKKFKNSEINVTANALDTIFKRKLFVILNSYIWKYGTIWNNY